MYMGYAVNVLFPVSCGRPQCMSCGQKAPPIPPPPPFSDCEEIIILKLVTGYIQGMFVLPTKHAGYIQSFLTCGTTLSCLPLGIEQ